MIAYVYGKPIDECSRDDLIRALEHYDSIYRQSLKDHSADLNRLLVSLKENRDGVRDRLRRAFSL